MTDILNINWIASSDTAILEALGAFIRHHRLQQNKTQELLAKEAGIVRSTLSLFERGENISLIVFIQLLRALKLLPKLQEFQIRQQISPLQLAEMERSKRSRAGKTNTGKSVLKPETDW